MFKTKTHKENVLHRLKITRGHIEKVLHMVEEDAYCIDVLTQTKAIRSALSKVDELLLEYHLQHCVVDYVKQGHSQKAISEILKVFKERK